MYYYGNTQDANGNRNGELRAGSRERSYMSAALLQPIEGIAKPANPILEELRARLGVFDTHFQREALPYSRLSSGLPRGALVEITGPGKTSSVVQFLAENSGLRAAWVESHFSLLPSAFPQRSANLEKIFFVEAGKNAAWAASTILRAQLFPILVYSGPYACERELRRFQLLSERSKTTMILLGEKPLGIGAWPIRLSLEARGRELSLVKGKG